MALDVKHMRCLGGSQNFVIYIYIFFFELEPLKCQKIIDFAQNQAKCSNLELLYFLSFFLGKQFRYSLQQIQNKAISVKIKIE